LKLFPPFYHAVKLEVGVEADGLAAAVEGEGGVGEVLPSFHLRAKLTRWPFVGSSILGREKRRRRQARGGRGQPVPRQDGVEAGITQCQVLTKEG